jgi:hypothetical protein
MILYVNEAHTGSKICLESLCKNSRVRRCTGSLGSTTAALALISTKYTVLHVYVPANFSIDFFPQLVHLLSIQCYLPRGSNVLYDYHGFVWMAIQLFFAFEEILHETPTLYMVNLKATVSRFRIHDESFFFFQPEEVQRWFGDWYGNIFGNS